MIKKKIVTKSAPEAIGPYSQAIQVDQFIFVSGQLPIDPATGELLQGDIRKLTNRVLDNIKAILEAANSSLADIVRTDVFLTNLSQDFPAMNEEYAKRFVSEPPARQTVEVSRLPKGATIEISCIACVSE